MLRDVLSLQNKEGFFPTYKFKKGDIIEETPNSEIKNIGIHSFLLEKILKLSPSSIQIKNAFVKGFNYLLKDSVYFGGRFLWRWLKNPTRMDYLYPPDVDDTARARAVIEIAKQNNFLIPLEFQKFDYENFLLENLTEKGVLTFIGNKPNNVVCPVVNANILYSFGIYLKGKMEIPENNPIYNKVKIYLEQFIENKNFQETDFHNLSKFYLSSNFFGYIISEQKENFNQEILNKIRVNIENKKGNYENSLESAFATSALIRLDGDFGIIKKGIKKIFGSKNKNGLWDAYPLYQHRRLNNVFGSVALTSLFCLESIINYSKLAQTV